MDDERAGARIKAVARNGNAKNRSGEVTLNQLRIFWAVARSETLTKAAKQLGLAQPSLSQQLSKLEANVGTLLFHRRSNEMALTEAGSYLLPKAEQVLRNMRELEDGLAQFSGGKRLTLRLAGINSVLRVLLPGAIGMMQSQFPEVDFDIQESAPADILELLYGRRVNIGLLAANSVAQAGVGFVQIPLIEDPYVLVVPEALTLDGIADPQRDLPQEQLGLLNQSIQFTFGSQQANRVADWYDRMLPQHRVVAQCRSFETAIGLVRAGSGVCLAPALATIAGNGPPGGVRLYRVKAPPRRIVALVPSQYRRAEPYASLLELLQQSAAVYATPGVLPTPPFLAGDMAEDF
ncbi:carbonate dehydratase [Devosia yakushimensis]|uniref:Carbonate dehydratase n=1 Tax=Devosia yakushimensis TaxID=470028 RepID=A0ABQ5UJ28_9HYPH|nr:LysR family transcriptional regulator [Devosia yakushimensis]GLQ11840.1 carbonate dehydratase [Devosia yakushimensis]